MGNGKKYKTYLEGKVLQEMCGSIGPVRLCAASSIDPYTDGRRLGPRGVLGSDLGANQSIEIHLSTKGMGVL